MNKLEPMKVKKITCIGAGYVGGPTMAVIADNCPEIIVTIVDIDENRINAWKYNPINELPIYEPKLGEIIERVRNKNLFFSTDISESIANADMVFLAVNTPTKTKGIGSGQASDLSMLESCSREVAKCSRGHTIVVEKSTVPVRTAEVIKKILDANLKKEDSSNPQQTFSVISNPEFLAEGTAISDLNNPDRVLIGGDNELAIESLADIYSHWVDRSKIIKTNLWSSELSKLTSNAFLAQRISSINSVAEICEVTGANIKEVSKAIGLDNRIGKKFLNSGPGFGGSCFQKDILNLVYLCEYFGLTRVARYWQSVIELNDWQQERISKLITENLLGNISSKFILILGFAFKANTNDTRESSAIQISLNLLEEGANLLIHDPQVNSKQISLDLRIEETTSLSPDTNYNNKDKGKWKYVNNLSNSFSQVDAVVILTEWEEYKLIDWKKVTKKMRKPAWVFDTRLLLEEKNITDAGLNYWSVGNGR